MDTKPPPTSVTRPTKPLRLVLQRCAQCGEIIHIEQLSGRTLRPPVLCVDCAFDDIPHTD